MACLALLTQSRGSVLTMVGSLVAVLALVVLGALLAILQASGLYS